MEAETGLACQPDPPLLPRKRISTCVFLSFMCWIIPICGVSICGLMAGHRYLSERNNISNWTIVRGALLSDATPCEFRVFSNGCDTTSLQLHVSLGMALSNILREDEIIVSGEDAEFRVKLNRCNQKVGAALASERGSEAWKSKLSPIVNCGLFVSLLSV